MGLSQTATSKVQQAVKRGVLPRLDGSILCMDCGLVATCYDHRDYSKPLEVDPVCMVCNKKRGPAKNHTPKIEPNINKYGVFSGPKKRVRTMAFLQCLRCLHQWIPRQGDVRLCPKCKTVNWDKPLLKN